MNRELELETGRAMIHHCSFIEIMTCLLLNVKPDSEKQHLCWLYWLQLSDVVFQVPAPKGLLKQFSHRIFLARSKTLVYSVAH